MSISDESYSLTAVSPQAFYLPNKDRPNFNVLLHADVSRVLTKTTANTKLSAVGVEVVVDGKVYAVNATKEVILCAGCATPASCGLKRCS